MLALPRHLKRRFYSISSPHIRPLRETQSTAFTRPVDSNSCTLFIKSCSRNLKSLKSVHASMLKSELQLNIFFCTNLIAQYFSLGSVSYACTLFCSLQSLDVFLWNVMLRGFVNNGSYRKCMDFYDQMLEQGIRPDNFTFPFILKACGFVRDFEFGAKVHNDVLEFGYESDVFVGNSLVSTYGKCERWDIARKVFDDMHERNVVSWSSVIGAYAQNGKYEEGVLLFLRMLNEGLRPNRGTVLNVMACVYTESEADYVWRVISDNELSFDRSVQNAAMVMYARCGKIDIARKFFHGILNRDLLCWASMIEAYVGANQPLKALELFREMILRRIFPDYVVLLSVISACSSLASLHQACFIHGLIIKSSLKNCTELETAIVDLYVKCGNLLYARRVFDNMHERNVISWSIMISGYGIHGNGREALGLFNQMKKGRIKPDHIAFVSVLAACSHGGLIAEGWECFNSMIKDFNLTPRIEHYACMVDLLGRAGRLDEAFDFITRMPVMPNSAVWGALLGACKIHLNVEMAEVAIKHLFELDGENPGRYVLLSNIYSSTFKRTAAAGLRDMMRRRGVRKTAGHSIVEVTNRIYTFVAGDRSHPESDSIYTELDKLVIMIRHQGYVVPDLKFEMHDMEEEI